MSPQLVVADMARSLGFYTEKLGFEVDFRYEGFYAGVIKGSCSIHLKAGKSSKEERENRRNNEHVDIIFSVEGIENLYRELLDHPVEVIQSLRDMPYGREFYIADPDDYILAFLEEI